MVGPIHLRKRKGNRCRSVLLQFSESEFGGKVNTKNIKERSNFVKALLALIMFSGLFIAVPEYVEYEEVYPDELFDLFAIPNAPQHPKKSLVRDRSIPLFSEPVPEAHAFQLCHLDELSLQPFLLRLISSVILLC